MPEKICFVVAPIGDEGTETRKRSDQVFTHVISPAVREKQYAPFRADHLGEPGLITSQVIQHIVDDPLVVADLTDRNPNVYYEVAIRHVLRRPLVQLIQKGEKLPFDIAGMRTIELDHHDLDSVARAKSEIVRHIEAIERPGHVVETPISVSLDLQTLRRSDDPQQRTLADLVAAMAEVKSSLATIERILSGTPVSGTLLQPLGRITRRSSVLDPAVSSGSLVQMLTREADDDTLRRLQELMKSLESDVRKKPDDDR